MFMSTDSAQWEIVKLDLPESAEFMLCVWDMQWIDLTGEGEIVFFFSTGRIGKDVFKMFFFYEHISSCFLEAKKSC